MFLKYRFIFYDIYRSGPFSSKPNNLIENIVMAAIAEDVKDIYTLFRLD